MSLSVIIPVHNEKDSIENTLAEIYKVLKDGPIKDYEIIAVDDGSTDNTAEILEEFGPRFNTRLIIHERNMGYGAALKSGIRESRYDIIAITDADGTYPVKDIPKLYEEMGNCAMVVGDRSGKKAKIPLARRPAKWFLNKLANYLTGCKIPDLNSGLRLFKKNDAIRFFGILPGGFSFTSTLTLAMLTNDLQVKFIPIAYLARKGKSKIKPIRDTLNFIQLIIRTVLYFNPLKVFVPVSLVLFLMSLGVLFYSAFAMERILDTTVAILFVAGLHMLSIGMIADIIDKRNR